MMEWILETNRAVIYSALGGLSAITFIGSLILIPILVARLPANYFRGSGKPSFPWATRHPVLRWTLLIGKNVIGMFLIAGGILMLVLPGQGLLTILMGLVLMNYPGKRRLERYFVSRPPILRGINWLRKRSHRPPLNVHPAVPDDPHKTIE